MNVDCLQPLYACIRKSEWTECKAHSGGGEVCEQSSPHPVKSSVLRWHPVLLQCYLRVQGSNKNIQEITGCEQSIRM